MNHRLFIRKFHRYLALIVSIQLLLWSIGGFYFSINPIDQIHGDHLVNRDFLAPPTKCDFVKGMASVNEDLAGPITHVTSVAGPTRWFWLVSHNEKQEYRDWCTGQPSILMSEADIKDIAQRISPNAGSISSASWITSVEVDSEFRGKSLPAWRVNFDGEENLHLYLNGYTGNVITARTERWRIFDFLWMLHVMDYETRDDFNHLLLQTFALMAIITSFSGILLWWISRKKRAR